MFEDWKWSIKQQISDQESKSFSDASELLQRRSEVELII